MESLLDLDRQLEQTTVITDDSSLFEFMCDMGMRWREAHNLPPVDRKLAGRLYIGQYRGKANEKPVPNPLEKDYQWL